MDEELTRPLRAVYLDLYRPHKLAGCSEKTHRQYLVQFGHLDRFLRRPATLADLNDDTLIRCMGWMRKTRSAPTVNKFRSHMLALWRFLARKHIVPVWPDVGAMKEPERIPRAWSEPELAALLKAASEMPGKVGSVPAGRWWLALLLVCWDTGERITAVMRSSWGDLDLADRWVYFPAENRKGGRRDRQFRLHADTVAALNAIRSPIRERVFFWPWTETSLWGHFTDVLIRAGLPHDRKCKFHKMRRSVATHAEAAGLNATEILGHSCRRVTEGYLDPRFLDKPQAADVLFRPGGGCCG